MSNNDVFDPIHTLLKQRHLEEALRRVYDPRKDAIKSPFDQDLNHAWYIVGDIYYRSKRVKKAIIAFQRSLEDWREDSEAHCALGSCYTRLRQFSKAENSLRKALALKPKSEDLIYNLANALFDQKKYEEAIQWYKKVRNLDSVVGKRAVKNLKLAKSRFRHNNARKKQK